METRSQHLETGLTEDGNEQSIPHLEGGGIYIQQVDNAPLDLAMDLCLVLLRLRVLLPVDDEEIVSVTRNEIADQIVNVALARTGRNLTDVRLGRSLASVVLDDVVDDHDDLYLHSLVKRRITGVVHQCDSGHIMPLSLELESMFIIK
jgi:hypothetical protein